MSHPKDLDIPQPDARDRLHKLTTILLSPVPGASDILSEIVKPPLDRRLNEWRESVREALIKLQEQIEDFNLENLSENDKFITAILHATRIVVETHQAEKRETLCNAVLNSALPSAPDDDKQHLYLELVGSLTVTHIKILKLLAQPGAPVLNLDDPKWKTNIARDKMIAFIEAGYPEMKGQYSLSIYILGDLHSKALIAHSFPAKDRLTRIERSPTLTPLARDFLQFIESPLKHEKQQEK